jgi:hypothetical protein
MISKNPFQWIAAELDSGSFSLEQSADPVHGWHSDPASLTLHADPEDLGNGLESVTFRIAVLINAGENGFLRLRVIGQP